MDIQEIATNVASKILKNIKSRKGFSEAWSEIDSNIKKEIINEWTHIIEYEWQEMKDEMKCNDIGKINRDY